MICYIKIFLGGDNMKFCPNCGSILEGKLKCDCGYDTLTGEVDEKIYKDFKNNEKSLYEQSCDNLGMMDIANQNNIIGGAKMMGMNSNLSTEEVLKQMQQPIFNKDNDNIYGEELAKIMKDTYLNDSTENNGSN